MPLDPDAVDEDLVVARVAGVRALPLGDGRTLLDQEVGAFLAVSPTGAIVWKCLDGSSSLGDICRDLAEVFDAPLPTVTDDTLALVRRMAERGLVRDANGAGSELSVLERIARRHRAPGARRAFAPDPWGAITVRSGDRLLGLGISDREVFELARAAVVRHRLVGDANTPELRLLVLSERGAIPGMHALYRDGRCVLRATGEGRMVRAALLHLGALAKEPDDTVRLQGRVAVGHDGVTLIVGTHLEILDHAAPRLGRLGWRVLDVPGPLVDVDTLEVVVTEPPDFLDPRGLAEIDHRFPPGPSELPVRPGRYEIRNLLAVGTFGSDDHPRDPASTREAMLAVLAPSGDAEARGDVARTVAGLVDRVEPRWLDGGDHRELLGVLEELAGDGRSTVTERGGKHE
jgi:hypothetical protein